MIQKEIFTKIGEGNQRILNLQKGKNGIFYFATADKLFMYDAKASKINELPFSKFFENDFITTLDFLGNDFLWVGTEKGKVYVFKNQNFYNQFNFSIKKKTNIKTIKVDGGKLWVGTFSEGIIRGNFNPQAPRKLNSLVFINTLKGLVSDNINCIQAGNGYAYAATKAGISVIPGYLSPRQKIYDPAIIKTMVEGQQVENSSQIQLNRDQHNVSFLISLIDFTGTNSTLQYAIDNRDEWLDITDNLLNLSISSRQAEIYIRAVNSTNNARSNTLKIKIKKKLYFYEYNEFWLITGGLIFGTLLFIGNRRRLRIQEKAFEEELKRQNFIKKERERISHDMHDDLGAGISALKLQAEFLKHKVSDESLKQDINDLLHTSEEMNISMREILWSLNSRNDNLCDFIKYVDQYGEKFFSKTHISFNIYVAGVSYDQPISTDQRRNLYLSIKEAFNNCYKHSKATNVSVNFSQDKNLFTVEVKDNGAGLPSDLADGNGLKSMKYRMEEIGGIFKIFTSAEGTVLLFSLEL